MEQLALNAKQREVVEHFEGPILVVAGPGSGKTRVIIERIAGLLSKGVPAENILALTFSNKAAEEMADRLAERVSGSYGELWVGTFHSFGGEILRNHWVEAGVDPFFRLLSEGEQVVLLSRALSELPLRQLEVKGIPYRLAGALSRMISRAKDELIGAEEYAEYARRLANGAMGEGEAGGGPSQPDLFTAGAASETSPGEDDLGEAARADEIARLYGAYERAKAELGALDFGDLISLALRVLTGHPSVLRAYQERYRFILVDEFQDTNYAQNRLLGQLAAAHKNLCVVGDDDQSIYRFRGAALKNILDFERAYPEARVVRLEENYRSVPEVLKAACSVVTPNTERISKRLRAARPDPGEPRVILWECTDADEEATAIAREITRLKQEQGLSWSDFAVLCRSLQTQGQQLTLALQRGRIAHKVAGGSGFYSRPEVRDLVALLRLVADPGDNNSFLRAASLPTFGFSALDQCSLSAWAKELRSRRLIEALKRGDGSLRLSARAAAGGRSLLSLVEDLHPRAKDMTAGEALELLLDRTGYFAQAMSLQEEERDPRLANIEKLRGMVAAAEGPGLALPGFMERLDALIAAEVSEAPAVPLGAKEAVLLSTVHQAKGLEFPVVFVAGLADQRFPMRRRADPLSIPDELLKEDLPEEERGGLHLEEERRLCYVALTRAKNLLYMSYPKRASGGVREAKPSPFLIEVGTELGTVPTAPQLFSVEDGALPATVRRGLAAAARAPAGCAAAAGFEGRPTPTQQTQQTQPPSIRETRSAPGSGATATAENLLPVLEAALAYVGAEIEARLEGAGLDPAPALQRLSAASGTFFRGGRVTADAYGDSQDDRAAARPVTSVAQPESPSVGLGARTPGLVSGRGQLSAEKGSFRPYLPIRNGGLVLSYSQIDRYRRCPLQYFYGCVLRLPTKSSIELAFGNLVHQVLERFHRKYGEKGSLNDLLDLFQAGWRTAFPLEGTAEHQLKERAVGAFTRYHARFSEESGRPAFLERKFHLKIGPHLVRGRVDRVDQVEGGWELIDYKTGRALPDREVKADLQLSVYHLGARQAWGIEPEFLSYYFVMSDEKRHVSRSEDQLREAEAVITEVAEDILAEKFGPSGDFATCGRCDFRLLCPKLESN